MLSNHTRQEYARELSVRYKAASRSEKSRILEEFCQTCGYNRKYAMGLLRNPPPLRKAPIKRPRATRYDAEVRRVLLQVWEMSNGLCSKRLVPFLPKLLDALERHNELCVSAPLSEKLLGISAATVDRLLGSARRSHPMRGRSTTKPGTLLREQIRVRTEFAWDEQKPGYFEADLVAHCAESTAGEFLYTLTLTDIATGWTECQPLLNRSQIGVTQAIERIRTLLPFPIFGIDSDNGTEFINHNLKRYCEERNIEFTRSRPYKKNDQCHVEQKNWTVVRQHIGYARYEGVEEWRLLGSVHRWLRRHVNFFQPSVKLLSKDRDQAKIRKRYDQAKTPYQRLIDYGILPKDTLQDLETFYLDLNPLDLLRQLSASLNRLQKAQIRRQQNTAADPCKTSTERLISVQKVTSNRMEPSEHEGS